MKPTGIIGIVAVKSNSNRFPGKNFAEFQGKPLFAHAVDLLLHSKVNKVYIATDSEIPNDYYRKNKRVKYLVRHYNIIQNEQPLWDVWKWAYYSIAENPEWVVCSLANCKMHTPTNVNNMIALAQSKKLKEVRSFSTEGIENGLILFHHDSFKKPDISPYMGAVITLGREIHYEVEL